MTKREREEDGSDAAPASKKHKEELEEEPRKPGMIPEDKPYTGGPDPMLVDVDPDKLKVDDLRKWGWKLILDRHINQTSLAKYLGCPQSMMSMFLNNKYTTDRMVEVVRDFISRMKEGSIDINQVLSRSMQTGPRPRAPKPERKPRPEGERRGPGRPRGSRQVKELQAAKFAPHGSQSKKGDDCVPPHVAEHLERGYCRSVNDCLVPITLNISEGKYMLKDTFSWNLNETQTTPEDFAAVVCEDFKVPGHFAAKVAQQIRGQVSAYRSYLTVAGQERLVRIKIDISHGSMALKDQFWWDISDKRNNPDEFAEVICADLGLDRAMVSLISQSIYNQLQVLTKEAVGGNLAQDDVYAGSESAFRYSHEASKWSPQLRQLTQEEMKEKAAEQARLRKAQEEYRQQKMLIEQRKAARKSNTPSSMSMAPRTAVSSPPPAKKSPGTGSIHKPTTKPTAPPAPVRDTPSMMKRVYNKLVASDKEFALSAARAIKAARDQYPSIPHEDAKKMAERTWAVSGAAVTLNDSGDGDRFVDTGAWIESNIVRACQHRAASVRGTQFELFDYVTVDQGSWIGRIESMLRVDNARWIIVRWFIAPKEANGLKSLERFVDRELLETNSVDAIQLKNVVRKVNVYFEDAFLSRYGSDSVAAAQEMAFMSRYNYNVLTWNLSTRAVPKVRQPSPAPAASPPAASPPAARSPAARPPTARSGSKVPSPAPSPAVAPAASMAPPPGAVSYAPTPAPAPAPAAAQAVPAAATAMAAQDAVPVVGSGVVGVKPEEEETVPPTGAQAPTQSSRMDQ